MELTVDLNCDMGEGFANDAELMDYVSSVNNACGYHAGDLETMRRTVETALSKGVAIGAHPGYRDRENFGRNAKHLSNNEIRDLVTDQVETLSEICRGMGSRLHHVKPHGALYNQAVNDRDLARTIAEAVCDVDETLVYFGLSGSLMIDEAKDCGLRTASEVFADRTYKNDGSLTPRTESNALVEDQPTAIGQILDMIKYSRIRSTDGIMVAIQADTVCIHGDGKHALQFACAVREKLLDNGVEIRPL